MARKLQIWACDMGTSASLTHVALPSAANARARLVVAQAVRRVALHPLVAILPVERVVARGADPRPIGPGLRSPFPRNPCPCTVFEGPGGVGNRVWL